MRPPDGSMTILLSISTEMHEAKTKTPPDGGAHSKWGIYRSGDAR